MNLPILIPIACMVVMFTLASELGGNVSISSRVWNLFHVPAFFGLTLLWSVVFFRLGLSRWVALAGGAGLSLLFGLAIELYQLGVPGRYASRLDLLLNLVGVGMAIVVGLVMWGLCPRQLDADSSTGCLRRNQDSQEHY